jgi:hypothetical protein
MRKILIVAAVTGLMAVAAATGASAAPPPGSGKTYYLGAVGDFEMGKKYQPDEVKKKNQEALAAAVATTEAPEGLAVTAATATPSGFKLWNPGARTTNYIYNSNHWGVNHLRCHDGCVVIDKWQTQLNEYAYGRSSTRWQLTMNADRLEGTTDTSFSYEYYCGRDIDNGGDVLCAGGGADHSSSGAINPGDAINKSFGSSASNRVFPMVRMTALFSTGVRVSTAFRGWDVCNNNFGGIKLCAAATY